VTVRRVTIVNRADNAQLGSPSPPRNRRSTKRRTVLKGRTDLFRAAFYRRL
jgi:hypothetical protein